MKRQISCLLLAATCLLGQAQAMDVNKCTGQDGAVSFQTAPCPADAAATAPRVESRPTDWALRIPTAPTTQPMAQGTQERRLREMEESLNALQRAISSPPPTKKKATKARARTGIDRARPFDVREAIMEHRVLRGMDKAEVRESLGVPSSVYTSRGYESWTYAIGGGGLYQSSTLVFRGALLDHWDNYRGH